MNISNRYCVIMCGGVGSRFWPFSREDEPKQFLDLFGTGRNLLQMTVDRMNGIVPPENLIFVTNKNYASRIQENFPEIDASQILCEPARRNTAPCIAWATYHIMAKDPNAQIAVLPSDHLILNVPEFQRCLNRGFEFLENKDALLTLGIKPSRPETGYGYIQIGDAFEDNILKVKTFTEKPNADLAQVFLQSGEFFWNSGIFLWSAESILKALHDNAPDITEKFESGLEHFGTPSEQQFINESFPQCPNISIDFAVMEKASNVYVQCVDFGWSDLGSWGSLYDNSPKNREGNVTQNCNTLLVNCSGNMIAERGDKVIVISNLNDYIVADTDRALVIVPRSEEQKIKVYVNEIKSKFGDKYL